jgi:hypothetical protein
MISHILDKGNYNACACYSQKIIIWKSCILHSNYFCFSTCQKRKCFLLNYTLWAYRISHVLWCYMIFIPQLFSNRQGDRKHTTSWIKSYHITKHGKFFLSHIYHPIPVFISPLPV